MREGVKGQRSMSARVVKHPVYYYHLGHISKDCRARPTPTAAMEFQEYPDLHPQQRYYQQQEYLRYSQYPETEKADNYPCQEKVVPVDAQSLRPRYGQGMESVHQCQH